MGRTQTPGDYLYGDSRLPYREAGLWGLLRVHPRGESVDGLRPLVASSRGWPARLPLAIGAVALPVIALTLLRRRRSSRVWHLTPDVRGTAGQAERGDSRHRGVGSHRG